MSTHSANARGTRTQRVLLHSALALPGVGCASTLSALAVRAHSAAAPGRVRTRSLLACPCAGSGHVSSTRSACVSRVVTQHKPNAHWDCVGGGNTPTVPKTPAPPLCWWCLATHSDLCVKNVGVSALRRVFDCNPTASPGTTATLLRRSELLRRTGYCSPTASPGTATLLRRSELMAYLYSRSSRSCLC